MWNACGRAKAAPVPPTAGRAAFAAPTARPAGWWRDDHVEQLRTTRPGCMPPSTPSPRRSLATAVPVRQHRQADHEQTPLPHTQPPPPLLDHPNLDEPWELWYLTVLYWS